MAGKRLRVLIVGGYGMFGSRLVKLLSNESRVELLVAGRSRAKAERLCQTVSGDATLIPTRFDRDKDVHARISELNPDVVIDVSGPWQSYGARPYRLAESAISNRAHYLDIADGRSFVQGISALNDVATRNGVSVLSGASTCSALTGAVCRHLAVGLARIHSIAGGIAPSPYVPMGRSVIEAIAGYSGKLLPVWREGRSQSARALVDAKHFTIAPPGSSPLPNTQFLLVDVPDLDTLRNLPLPVDTVWFGVATRPAIFQRLHRLIARFVGLGMIRSMRWLVRPMQLVKNHLSWGEHRGGLFVRVVGESESGRIADRAWHLVAEGDSGPNVPLLASVIVVRRMLRGHFPTAGARSAVNEFELADFQALFAEQAIHCGERSRDAGVNTTLFRETLGDTWARLPPTVRAAHYLSDHLGLVGTGHVTGGSSLLARLVRKAFGFPSTTGVVPVRVDMHQDDGVETWRRDFGGQRFSSTLRAGRGRNDGLICEKFGAVTIALALVVDDGKLRFVPRKASIVGVPLPKFLLPGGDMYESAEDGQFRFYVEVNLPLAGHVVTYEGSLQPES